MTKLDFLNSRLNTKDFVFIIQYIDNYCTEGRLNELLSEQSKVDINQDISFIIASLCSFGLGNLKDLKRWLEIYRVALLNDGLGVNFANSMCAQIFNLFSL